MRDNQAMEKGISIGDCEPLNESEVGVVVHHAEWLLMGAALFER